MTIPNFLACFLAIYFLLLPQRIYGDNEENHERYPEDKSDRSHHRDDKPSSLAFNEIDARHLRGARWELDKKDKKPTKVYFAMEILDISKISPTNGEFRLDFNLKQRWKAPQLKLPPNLFWENETLGTAVTVDGGILADLWTPDAYIPNSRDAEIEALTYPQKTVTIFKNNTIIYTSNMYTVNGCAMEFQWYPMETQSCYFQLESYSFTTRNVLFEWDSDTVNESVSLPRNFKLRQYVLTKPLRYGVARVHRFGRDDEFARLYVIFTLQRQLGHFILQTFMPTFFIVSLSWFSFWLGMDAIPGRVSLLVTCMLTLVTLYTGQKVDLPPVSYVKMMDVWMTACLAFVFAAMFEFVVVRYLAKNEMNKEWKTRGFQALLPAYLQELFLKKKKTQNAPIYDELRLLESRLTRGPIAAWNPPIYDESYPSRKFQGKHILNHFPSLQRRSHNAPPFERAETAQSQTSEKTDSENEQRKLWKRIDRAARWAFPLLFLCFCTIFWPTLMFGDPKVPSKIYK